MENDCIDVWKKERVYDAHVHFDMKKKDVQKDLIEYLEMNELTGIVLIINTREQMNALEKCREILWKYLDRIEFAFGVNKNDEFWKEGLSFCHENNKLFHIKIHPRLFGILQEEIEWYVNMVEVIKPQVVIVDDFFYGDSVKEDIGAVLACEIAKRNPKQKVVLAHAGGVNLLRHVMWTKIYRNIYYDISLIVNYFSSSSIEQDIMWMLKFMSERILLGSDYPDFTIHNVWEVVSRYIDNAGLTDEKIMQVMYKNAEFVYGGAYGKTD